MHVLLEVGQRRLLLLLPVHQHRLQVGQQLQRLCLLDQFGWLWKTWQSRLLTALTLLLLEEVLEGVGGDHVGIWQGCLRLEVGQRLTEGGLGGRN